jgi:hypothetical protein
MASIMRNLRRREGRREALSCDGIETGNHLASMVAFVSTECESSQFRHMRRARVHTAILE